MNWLTYGWLSLRSSSWNATRAYATAASLLAVCGCSAREVIRGAETATAVVRSCPEVTNLVAGVDTNWTASLGIEAGDATALKTALSASATLGERASDLDARLTRACQDLATDLDSPQSPQSQVHACHHASVSLSRKKAELGPAATVRAHKQMICASDCTEPCDPTAPEGDCARSTVEVQVEGAEDTVAEVRLTAALERFLSVIVLAVEWEAETRAAVSSARTALELGLATGEAVSDGNVAAAATAAICILPPLVATERRLQALHANLRLLRELAGSAGLDLPRPEAPEPPAARFTRSGTGAPAVMQSPLRGRILELFSFPDGGFAAQTPRGVVSLPDGQTLLGPGEGQRGGLGHLKCAVTFGRRVACLRVEEQHDRDGNYLGANLAVLDSTTGSQIVASVGRNGTLSDLGLTFDATGTLLFAYLHRQTVGDKTIVETRLVRGAHAMVLPFQPSLGALEQLGGSGRRDDPIQFVKYREQWHLFYRDGRTLLISRLDRPDAKIEVAARVSLDVRPVVGGDGLLYVFYHEPGSRRARVAISADGLRFFDRALDSRESGWQLEAIPTKDGALAAYYYFRNSYNKGIRVAALSGGTLVRRPSTLMREDRWNAGWHPHMACDRGGQVLLTYLSNVEADTRVWSRFNEPKNLLDYAMVDTGTCSAPSQT